MLHTFGLAAGTGFGCFQHGGDSFGGGGRLVGGADAAADDEVEVVAVDDAVVTVVAVTLHTAVGMPNGGLTVGLIGTIGFSVSVDGIGGHIRFSNFTTDGELAFAGEELAHPLSSPPPLGLDDGDWLRSAVVAATQSFSQMRTRLEMEPLLLRFSSSSSSGSGSSPDRPTGCWSSCADSTEVVALDLRAWLAGVVVSEQVFRRLEIGLKIGNTLKKCVLE